MNDKETEKLKALLQSIPEAFDTKIVLIDHDADLISTVCQHTLVLDFGRRLALGPTAEVLADPAVRRAYLGEE